MLTALLLLSLSANPSSPSETPAASDDTPLSAFFRQPDRVQIFVADNGYDFDFDEKKKKLKKKLVTIDAFVLTSKGIELSTEDREAIAQAWIAPEDMPPKDPKRCEFNPDIALRFWRGRAWVDAVVCFGCQEHAFYDAKGGGSAEAPSGTSPSCGRSRSRRSPRRSSDPEARRPRGLASHRSLREASTP
jgi:hypothetical protein